MKTCKKHFATLLELLIAMSIASILIIAIFNFYRFTSDLDQEMAKAEKKAFQMSLIQGRLTYVFSRAWKAPKRKKTTKPLFFLQPQDFRITKGPSLIFSFDSDTQDPVFTGTVLARLFVDEKNRLILAVWPYNLEENELSPPMHIEVIAENIESIDFEFLTPPKERAFGEMLTTGALLKDWKAEYEEAPMAVKMIITNDQQKEIPFAFFVPYCRPKL